MIVSNIENIIRLFFWSFGSCIQNPLGSKIDGHVPLTLNGHDASDITYVNSKHFHFKCNELFIKSYKVKAVQINSMDQKKIDNAHKN